MVFPLSKRVDEPSPPVDRYAFMDWKVASIDRALERLGNAPDNDSEPAGQQDLLGHWLDLIAAEPRP